MDRTEAGARAVAAVEVLAAAGSADLEEEEAWWTERGRSAGRGTAVRSQGHGKDDGTPAGTDDPHRSLDRDTC